MRDGWDASKCDFSPALISDSHTPRAPRFSSPHQLCPPYIRTYSDVGSGAAFWEYSRFVKFDFEQKKGGGEAATVSFLLENIGNRTESTLARSGHFGRIVLVVCVGRFGLGPHAQYTRTYSGAASEDSCREGEGCRKGEVRSGNSPRGGMETLAALPAPSLDPGRSECAVNHAGREKR